MNLMRGLCFCFLGGTKSAPAMNAPAMASSRLGFFTCGKKTRNNDISKTAVSHKQTKKRGRRQQQQHPSRPPPPPRGCTTNV